MKKVMALESFGDFPQIFSQIFWEKKNTGAIAQNPGSVIISIPAEWSDK